MVDDPDGNDSLEATFVRMRLPGMSDAGLSAIRESRPLTDEERRFAETLGAQFPDIVQLIGTMSDADLRVTQRLAVLLENYQSDATPSDSIVDDLRRLSMELGFDPASEVEWARHLALARAQLSVDAPVRNLCVDQRLPSWATALDFEQRVRMANPLEPDVHTCAHSLLTDELEPLPDHVCFDVLVESTVRFAQRAFPPEPTPEGEWPPRDVDLQLWSSCWPLPIGEKSLEHFARTRWVKKSHLPAPLVKDDPHAEVGLWVERRLPGGTVHLLGLVRHAEERQEIGVDVLQFEDAYIEKIPVPVSYRGRVPAAGRDVLHDAAGQLDRWYRRTVLGQRLTHAGRPPGPATDFDAVEGAAYQKAVRDLARGHRRLSYTAVATAMGADLNRRIGRTTLRSWIEHGWLPPLPRQSADGHGSGADDDRPRDA